MKPHRVLKKRTPAGMILGGGGGGKVAAPGSILPEKPTGDEVVTGALPDVAPCKSVYEVLVAAELKSFRTLLAVRTRKCS